VYGASAVTAGHLQHRPSVSVTHEPRGTWKAPRPLPDLQAGVGETQRGVVCWGAAWDYQGLLEQRIAQLDARMTALATPDPRDGLEPGVGVSDAVLAPSSRLKSAERTALALTDGSKRRRGALRGERLPAEQLRCDVPVYAPPNGTLVLRRPSR
jgi:hypothetical protein